MKEVEQLVSEILSGLDAAQPASALVSKAHRLALLVGDARHAELFRLHMAGPTKPLHKETNEEQEARADALVAYMSDRRLPGTEKIQAQSLKDLETLLQMAETVSPPSDSQSIRQWANIVADTRRILANATSRIASFVASIQKNMVGPTLLASSDVLEQKFGILLSPKREEIDFDEWSSSAAPGSTIAVLFCDIDDFKTLNTTFLEALVDDHVLVPIQELFSNLVQQRGQAYRHGGEEFVFILPNTDDAEALAFGEKLCRSVRALKLAIGEVSPKVTVSVGVALWPTHGDTYKDVLVAANQAEHSAKEAGKDRVSVWSVPRSE